MIDCGAAVVLVTVEAIMGTVMLGRARRIKERISAGNGRNV